MATILHNICPSHMYMSRRMSKQAKWPNKPMHLRIEVKYHAFNVYELFHSHIPADSVTVAYTLKKTSVLKLHPDESIFPYLSFHRT